MEHNKVLLLQVISSFVLSISLILNCLRICVRLLTRHGWALYDSAALVGVTFSIVSFALQVSYPTVTSAPAGDAQVFIAQNVVSAVALAASKCTTNLVTLKLHGHLAISKNHRIIVFGKTLVICSIVWGIFSILLLSIYPSRNTATAFVGCEPSTSWRWLAFDLTGAMIELAMAILVILAFWPLKMKLLLKIKGFSILESRILLIPLTLARAGLLVSFSHSQTGGCFFTSGIMNQVIVQLSIVFASINIITPTLKLYDLVPVVESDSRSSAFSQPKAENQPLR